MALTGPLHMVTEPTKHAILRALAKEEQTVSDLVQAVAAEQSNVSHHLRRLREGGLVRSRKDGRRRIYRLADAEMGRLLEEVDDLARRLDRATFYTRLEIPMDPAFHGYG